MIKPHPTPKIRLCENFNTLRKKKPENIYINSVLVSSHLMLKSSNKIYETIWLCNGSKHCGYSEAGDYTHYTQQVIRQN